MATNVGAGERIANTSGTVFIFLDGVDELVASLDIDLACLHDLLQDLGVLSRQFLHLVLLGEVLTAAFVNVAFARVTSLHARSHRPTWVLELNFLEALPVVVEALEAFELAEKVSLLDDDDLRRLLAGNALLGVIAAAAAAELGRSMRGLVLTRSFAASLHRECRCCVPFYAI